MIIFGIGTDIVQIARIVASTARSERFAAKILSPLEYQIYLERQAPEATRANRYLASRFAAKEAFSKALGIGFRDPVSWHSLEIHNDALGKPSLAFGGKLADYMLEHRLQAQISLSDEADYAVAFCIVTQA